MRCLLLLCALLSSSLFAGELAVIVNAESAVTSLTKEEVANYFLKKKATWAAGGAVEPVSYADDNPLRAAFDKLVLGMSIEQEERHWVEQGYAGGVKPPAKVPQEAMALAITALKKGALGYVNASAVTDGKVKVVFKVSY